ncbi:fibropellin-1-like [Mytilus californianus]|uniref:fibropellin-1-like n=1 Tax=Mytilus californianus TaxID=6549 RepID=UPI0022465A53|nr:fibropellin-1-like [Mytilus californianus]
MRFTKVTDDLFYFYLMSDVDTFVVPNERVFNPASQPNENGDVCSTFCSYTEPKPMIRTLRKQGTTDLLPNDAALCEPCGDSCKQNVDNCDPNPCLHGGLCTLSNVNPSYTCSCAAGYEGPNCETNVDNCDPNPCLHGGLCTLSNVNPSYTCSCAAGYEGPNCETNIDDCTPNPCLNGGQCSDDIASYTCSCAAGYKGNNCDQNIDDCTPNPCLNGGQCSDDIASYTCSCAAGYKGNNCDQNIDDCTPNPCLNGGQCSDDIASYTCSCAAGYKGNNCDQNIDDCTPNPCLNGGQCSDGVLSYTCSCVAGYGGKNCDRIACTVPGMVQFATEPTDKSFNNMETITYSCITGYEVQSGNLERSCQADGTWSGHPPVCKMTVDYFCGTLLEKLENEKNSKKGWNENSEDSSEKDTRGKTKGKYWNRKKGRRCGYYKALEALIIETCLLS